MGRTVKTAHAAFLLAVSLAAPPVAAGAVPDMLCILDRATQIDPMTLEGAISATRQVYRFKDAELFISSPDVPEYRYGRVMEVEADRYSSGYKTLILIWPSAASRMGRLLMVHSDENDMRVALFVCAR